MAGELSGTLNQHTWVGFKGGVQLATLSSLILHLNPLQGNGIFASNGLPLKRVNPATTWSTRSIPYTKRCMFSLPTQRRLSAVNLLVNALLALHVDSRLLAPGPGPPAAWRVHSSSSSESSGMMHPRPQLFRRRVTDSRRRASRPDGSPADSPPGQARHVSVGLGP